MLQLMEKPDIELAGHYLLSHPTARTLQIDKHLGAELLKQSHQPYMSTIIVHNEHKLDGRVSGLLILTRLADSMLQLTAHRMGSLLSSMFKPIKQRVTTYINMGN